MIVKLIQGESVIGLFVKEEHAKNFIIEKKIK